MIWGGLAMGLDKENENKKNPEKEKKRDNGKSDASEKELLSRGTIIGE